MKKRILSILICLCMAMTMMSSAVFARSEESDIDAHEDGHSHCICGSEHNAIGDHEDEDAAEFEAWEYTDSLPEEGGYYYLTDDVEIDETWYVPDGTVLCLNGFDIVMNADGTVIELEADYEFTLTDCSENQGNITHADEYKGRGVYISYTSEQTNVGTFKSYDTIFNMYGGNITENDWTGSNSNFQGAGVSNIGTFNMYGGSICKNTASNEGGGVYNNGIFNMYGGEIYENEALKGGGVYTTDKFYMSGGEITDNNVKGTSQDTTLGAWGGGVYVYLNYSVFEVSGNVKITGNTKTATNVKNNKVTDNNVCLSYSDDRVITLGDLDEDAKIGVSSDGLSKLRNGNIATVSDESALESYIDDGVLVSDDPAMDLYYEDGYIKLQMQELYDITLADTENGSYKVRVYGADVTKAAEGETIAIAATPDEDYVVDEVTYSDGINEYTTDFENNEYLFTMPAFDITVNVTFRDISNPFQVTYDANGGTGEVVDDGEYMYDTEAEVLSGYDLRNDGYYFTGWNTSPDGDGDEYKMGDEITILDDTTLYAQWEEVTAESFPIEDETFPYGYDIALTPEFPDEDGALSFEITDERDGPWSLEFAGTYSYMKNSGEASDALNDIAGDMADAYSLSEYEKNALVVLSLMNDGDFIGYGMVIAFDIAGKDKSVVFVSDDLGGGKIYLLSTAQYEVDDAEDITADLIYSDYAALQSDTYGISLNRSGTVSMGSEYVEYEEAPSLDVRVRNEGSEDTGDLYIELSGDDADCFTLDTYHIESFSDTAEFTIEADTGLDIGTYTAEVKVYGKNIVEETFEVEFEVKFFGYDITCDPCGGELDVTEYVTNSSGKLETTPDNPKKEGYSFKGWYDAETGGNYLSLSNHVFTEDSTIYAQWSINSYTISFDTDGGSSVASVSFEYGEEIVLPENPEKTGYTFVKWVNGDLESSPIPDVMPAKNLKLKAVWKTEKYTVFFDEDGGTYVPDITKEYNSIIEEPNEPTKEGHFLSAWLYEDGSEVRFPIRMPAGDITLKAKWMPYSYNVIFDTDGGSSIGKLWLFYGDEIVMPEDPTKEGHTFVKWVDESGNDALIPETMPDCDLTYKAVWDANEYTITFDADNGSDVVSITQDYGTAVTAPQNPIKTGYTFEGWADESGQLVNVPETIPAKDMNLKAVWTLNKHTISFATDGGSIVDSITQDYGTDITKPANPTKTGHTFVQWDKEIPTVMPDYDMTINAIWSVNKYIITFDTDGGGNMPSITQDYGTAVTAPENPTKTGYTFEGWADENGQLVSVPATIPAKNVSLKAVWSVNEYTISFDTDGGSYVANITQDYNTAITIPSDPVKEGHTFARWSKEIPAVMPAENTDIKAIWSINKYTLTFDSNGADDVPSITQDYATAVTAPENPQKTGYTFEGWADESGSIVSVPTTIPAKNMSFTAAWTVNQYTIHFDLDGGEGVESITKDYGSDVTRPENPTKTGYTFVKWSDTIPSVMPANDMSIKAIWSPNRYTVSFDLQGGLSGIGGTNSLNDIIVTFDSEYVNITNPIRVGYLFGGWYTAPEGGKRVMSDTIVKTPENHTLYARWFSDDNVTAEDVVFTYAYSGSRNPPYSKTGESIRVTHLDYPILADGTKATENEGEWTLTKYGTYLKIKNTDKNSENLKNIVKDVSRYYSTDLMDEIVIYELKNGSEHIAYGVTLAFWATEGMAVMDKALFIGDTKEGGATYVLTDRMKGIYVDVSLNMSPVNPAQTIVYRIALDQTGTYEFESARTGYKAQDPLTVTVSNVGTGVVKDMYIIVQGENADCFEANKESIASIELGGSDTFTITPKTGLAVGTYTARVRVVGPNVIPQAFDVSFTVNKKKSSGGGGGSSYVPTQPTEKPITDVTTSNDGNELTSGDNLFTDVDKNEYYAPAVEWALGKNITSGVSDDKFAPDGECTRAQMVTFLWRAAGCPKPEMAVNPFTDVEKGSYYEDAVLWAKEQGITNGVSDTEFGSDETCTRAQIATFLYRMAKGAAVEGENPFTDVADDIYYADAVAWAVENNITNGTGEGIFSPDETCTRAQLVTFLYRYFAK